MIPPLKAVASKTMMTNPYSMGATQAYKNTQNYSPVGSHLNIDCTNSRILSSSYQTAKNLDVMA